MTTLAGVHPDLAAAVARILAAMAAMGHPMRVIEGVRTAERQRALYAQGRSKPGPQVTNCDGVVKKSNHQPKSDGFGHAVDCAFQDDPRTPRDETWDETMPWATFGALVEAEGLVWGGRWPRLRDLPHVELRAGASEVRRA